MKIKKKYLIIGGIIIVIVLMKDLIMAWFWRSYFLRDFKQNKDQYYTIIDFMQKNNDIENIEPKKITFKKTGIYCYKEEINLAPMKLMDLEKSIKKTDDIVCDAKYQEMFGKIQALNASFVRQNRQIVFSTPNEKLSKYGQYMYCTSGCNGYFEKKDLIRKIEDGKVVVLSK